MIGITLLGATGSIGASTLDVLAHHPDDYRVVALTAHRDMERLLDLCLKHHPQYAVMVDEGAAERLRVKLHRSAVQVLSGAEGLEAVASLPGVDVVVAAIVGAAGLKPTLAAARAGKRVLLANKEALVITGRLFMDEVRKHGARLLPLDSEHNAVFQCLPAEFTQTPLTQLDRGFDGVGVERIWLTASGGPFRTTPLAELAHITPEQACAHPNWVMGRKISVDSATMMNKGLEVIEACWLFNTTPEHVQVVIHPQSIVHSLVEYVDGSFLAQLSHPDMRVPIAHALGWPQRMTSGAPLLDLFRLGPLSFEPADTARYPCLRLAYEAMRAGGTAAAILNAANEVAVHAFLENDLPFTAIPRVIEATLSALPPKEATTLEVILAQDVEARAVATHQVAVLREPNG